MMKTLYMIGGTMGVGKTTVCQQLKQDLPNSVFLDGDWCWDASPFQVTDETKAMVTNNICYVLNNFLKCSAYSNNLNRRRCSMAEKFPYEDIVNLPPHISKKHPQPSMMDRAARFAPFAAITGYEEMVLEEARVTEERVDLDEGALSLLNEKLNMIQEFLDEEPEVTITYFEPDKKKSGGAYITITGTVKRIDEYEHLVILTDGKKIRIEDIYALESDLFYSLGLDE